jgi:hypothetical protein
MEEQFKLGQWVSEQRKRESTISIDRKRRLDDLGFVWDPFNLDWEEGAEHLQAFIRAHGHCNVPQQSKSPNGYRLGGWVAVQRRHERSLSEGRRRRLDDLGFIWNVREAFWETGFSHLKSYRDREEHCLVPRKHIEDGFRLGVWVANQRPRRDSMSVDCRQRLTDLGFVWITQRMAPPEVGINPQKLEG